MLLDAGRLLRAAGLTCRAPLPVEPPCSRPARPMRQSAKPCPASLASPATHCSIQFGGGGIFGACKNIDISEINGYVTVREEVVPGGCCCWSCWRNVRVLAGWLAGWCAAPCAHIAAWPAPSCSPLTSLLYAIVLPQVRGEVGEVAPDGRVLRPARLTVQLEAPGAHK